MAKHIGFIGLGKMGQPMAARLIDAGYSLSVYDVNRAAGEALAAKGARIATSAAAIASQVDTVLLSLPNPAIVREVALGSDGVIAGSKVKVMIDLSTTGARTAREVAAALAAKEISAVDSPVSGGVAGAVKGTLAVMVACPRRLFAELEPMLKHIGKVFFIGERPGMGQTMKLANNLLSATALAATSEAIVFGVKAGLDPAVMLDVINAGSGRNSASQDKFPKSILPRTFDFGFTTGLMYKDLKLCLEEAEAAGVPMWIANAVRQLWQHAYQEIGADKDFTTIVQVLERWAGVEVRPGPREAGHG
jgi:3-hydroxyisobutyrate dehydrogenase-like beta-hydroxyacid dehydrogenase